MVYFIEIQPTDHYLKEHQKEVPWDKVLELIYFIKKPKKKQDHFEIKKEGYYILFKIENKIAYVINAKKERK
mgnify:CR=1 FL=1